MKLDVNNNYDIEGKKLTNLADGVDDQDAIVIDPTVDDQGANMRFVNSQIAKFAANPILGETDLKGKKLSTWEIQQMIQMHQTKNMWI